MQKQEHGEERSSLDSYRQERCILKSTSLVYSKTEYRKCDTPPDDGSSDSPMCSGQTKGFTLKAITLPRALSRLRTWKTLSQCKNLPSRLPFPYIVGPSHSLSAKEHLS